MKKLSLILLMFIAIQAIGQNASNLKEHFKGKKELTLSEDVYQKFNKLKQEKTATKTSAGNTSIEELVLFWNNNGWNDTIHKTEYVINELDQLVTWYHYIYENGKFEYFRKIEYSYDQAGNIIGSEIQGYNSSTATWYPASREIMKYDSHNNMTENKLELYSAGQWQVEFMQFLQFQYNTNGQITEKIETVQFNNAAPKFVEKEEIMYNASGKDSIFIYYQFDTTLTVWVPTEKIHEIIWSGNNITGAEYQLFDNGIWENYNKMEIGYNNLNEEIFRVIYLWDENNLVWESILKNTYSYFPNGDLDTLGQYQWTGTDWMLVDGEKFTYSYNASNDLFSRERELYELPLQSWVKTLKHIYTYSLISSVNSTEITEPEIKIYPNPANDQVTVSGLQTDKYKVDIYDVNGRLVSNNISEDSELKIDLTDLTRGLYLIQIKSENYSKALKFFKL